MDKHIYKQEHQLVARIVYARHGQNIKLVSNHIIIAVLNVILALDVILRITHAIAKMVMNQTALAEQ